MPPRKKKPDAAALADQVRERDIKNIIEKSAAGDPLTKDQLDRLDRWKEEEGKDHIRKLTRKTTATSTVIANLGGCSRGWVSTLAADGKIDKQPGYRYPVLQSLEAIRAANENKGGAQGGASTLQDARTKQALADAELKEIQKQKLEGQLADAGEMVEKVTELANAIEKIIRGSNLEEERKADIYSAIRDAAKDWSS